MRTLLYTTLAALGLPVYLQGALPEDAEYPPSFITYFTYDTSDAAHYDNDATAYAWQYQVNFYSSNFALIDIFPATIKAALKAAGFIPDGKGRDLPSGVSTHNGWTQDYYYLEQED